MNVTIATLALAAGLAMPVDAQTYEDPGSSLLLFRVFDPAANSGAGAWVQSMTAHPGQQVEWRMDAVYTGTRTDLFAMGEVIYQPTIRNADNVDGGDGIDSLGFFYPSGNIPTNCDPSGCPGVYDGQPLPQYGRWHFTGTSMSATGSSTMTLFRHSNGSDSAPPGDWMRLAGAFASVWPPPLGYCPVTPADINRVLRGVPSLQQSQALASVFHVAGLSNLIFRQAIILSNRTDARVLEIGTFPESQRRIGGTTSCDDRRYMTWQTGAADSGSHRTLYPTISSAFIFVTGTPCDSIDFNRDTLFPDVQDIADFLTVFSGGPCPTGPGACQDTDFNNDGLSPDVADIESLISVFGGGPCT